MGPGVVGSEVMVTPEMEICEKGKEGERARDGKKRTCEVMG